MQLRIGCMRFGAQDTFQLKKQSTVSNAHTATVQGRGLASNRSKLLPILLETVSPGGDGPHQHVNKNTSPNCCIRERPGLMPNQRPGVQTHEGQRAFGKPKPADRSSTANCPTASNRISGAGANTNRRIRYLLCGLPRREENTRLDFIAGRFLPQKTW